MGSFKIWFVFNWLHFSFSIYSCFFAVWNSTPKANRSPLIPRVARGPIEPNTLDLRGCSAKSEWVLVLCQMSCCLRYQRCSRCSNFYYWYMWQEVRIEKRRKRFWDSFFSFSLSVSYDFKKGFKWIRNSNFTRHFILENLFLIRKWIQARSNFCIVLLFLILGVGKKLNELVNLIVIDDSFKILFW